MKIFQVIPALSFGGAEIMVENLSYALKKRGHEVCVISLSNYNSEITKRLQCNGIEVRFMGKRPGFDPSVIIKLKKLLKKEKPDAVHAHLNAVLYAMPAAILAGIKKRVYTIHSVAEHDGGKLVHFVNKILFKRMNVIPIALSPLVRESAQKLYGIEAVQIINNGIDLSKCKVKTDYSIKNNATILHIGRFSRSKNHSMLISAFSSVHEKYPQTRLQLIGAGEEKENAENLVRELRLTNCVEFVGETDKVFEYLNGADIFVLPSLFEGQPITLIEAMGTGLPIVATCVGGIPDMVSDKENGILSSLDTESIASSLGSLLESAELREKIGKNATESAKIYSADVMAGEYEKIYKQHISL